MGYEKVMKRQREKAQSEVCQSDRQTDALPQPLYGGSVVCELIQGASPQISKVMGICCQIPAQRAIIMGINQELTHCYKYVTLQGRGLCKNRGFKPKTHCHVSHRVQMQNAGGCALPKSHKQVRVLVCNIATEHSPAEARRL